MGILELLTSWGNRVAILGSVLLFMLTFVSHQADIPLSTTSLRIAHLISFSSWFGTSVWMSFIAGVVLIQAVDMDTFGRVQAKLFDAYFRFSLLCLAVAGFSGAGLLARGPPTDVPGNRADGTPVGVVPFLVAVLCVAANLFFVGPQTTITMFERQRVCKELGVDRKSPNPEVRKLSKRFGMFHGISNLLNLVGLICGLIHASTLGSRLNL